MISSSLPFYYNPDLFTFYLCTMSSPIAINRLSVSHGDLSHFIDDDDGDFTPIIPGALSHTKAFLRLTELEDENSNLKSKVISLESEIARLQLMVNVDNRRRRTTENSSIEERVSMLEKRIAEMHFPSTAPVTCNHVAAASPEKTSSLEKSGMRKRRSGRKKKKKTNETTTGATESGEHFKSVIIWGDSMIRKVKVSGPTLKVKKMCRPGATLKSMSAALSANSESSDPHSVLFHIGTNSIKKTGDWLNDFDAEFSSFLETATKVYPTQLLIFSGVIHRRDYSEMQVNRINDVIEQRTTLHPNTRFVDPNSWLGQKSLAPDGLHLNDEGSKRLGGLYQRLLSPKASR